MPTLTRREAAQLVSATALMSAIPFASPTHAGNQPAFQETVMPITCFIRYQIDPFQREAFATYAERWSEIIPRCGGHLVGYFLPNEGTNDIGYALITCASLADYEAYRARLRADKAAQENFAFSQEKRFILREERTFLTPVGGGPH